MIPARAGSKGVPGKNMRRLGRWPLIAWAIKACQQVRYPNRLIVSTDSPEIARIARRYGAEVPFQRPAELATDSISIIPVVQHAVREMADRGFAADIVINVQPTCPFILPADIDAGLAQMAAQQLDSVVSVTEIVHGHPYRAKQIVDGRLFAMFPEVKGDTYLQRQDLPKAYAYSGAIYIRRSELVLKWSGQDFCLGAHIGSMILPQERAINIDTVIDFDMAKLMIRERNKKL